MNRSGIIITVFTLMLLTACSAGKTVPEKETAQTAETSAAAVTLKASEAVTAAAVTETSAASQESASSVEGVTEKAAETESDAASESNISEDAENIGINTRFGYFVKYGDRILFRRPGADSMEQTAVFGNFMSQMLGTSEIMSFDTVTGELKTENSSLGYGPMALCGDTLYLSEYDYPNDLEVEAFVSLGLESGDYIYECGEKLEGTGKDGKWAISSEIDHVNDTMVTRLFYTFGEGYEVISSTDQLLYIGTADKYLIYEERRQDAAFLWRCNMETGELLCLGELPGFEEQGISYPGEAEGFAYEEGMIAVIFSAYDGTGHFYAGSHLVTADVSRKDSLSWSDTDYSSAYYYDEMNRGPGVVISEGKAVLTDGMPYEVEIDYRDGNMILFTENGMASEVCSGYEFSEDEEGITADIEIAEYVDGKIYAVQNRMRHAKEDDIGWRYAYERKLTEILEIDPETGAETVIVSVESAD
ncbi:MAG: hypothetical protein MJ059_08645 [Lachnospiraceae bacterium]|nr:hypothetical protein [Lachnospiraceae bacterium]